MRRRVLLAVVLIEVVVLFAPTLGWLIERWTMSVWHNAHGLGISIVLAYFIWQQLRPLRQLPEEASAWGFAFLVPALLVYVLDTGAHTELASAVSLLLALPGLSLLFLGPSRTRVIAFPLALTALILPIPLAFTEHLQMQLRELATTVAASTVSMLGTPVLVEGTTLRLPNVSLLVSDACSGFSTLYAALTVACLTAHATANVRQRVTVLLVAVPLAIVANLVRVTLLALLVLWQGDRILQTWLHPLSGIVTFALVLPIIFYLGEPSRRPLVGASP